MLAIGLNTRATFLHAGDMVFLQKETGDADEIAELLADVERAIRIRTGGTIRALHVVLSDGEIVVTGETRTYYNKMLATHAALDAAQGGKVANNIHVNP
jgi:hypothetical protein